MSDTPFLPESYEVPTAESGYFKLRQGENRFRILDSAIIGTETWVTDSDGSRKPRRFRSNEDVPADLVGDTLKHFWAFPVWNYEAKRVQILELTQKGLMKAIRALTKDDDWGDPKGYDIVITREGEGLETEYQLNPKPHKKLDEGIAQFYKDLEIKLERLFDGGDPFSKEIDDKELDEIAKGVDELPFD